MVGKVGKKNETFVCERRAVKKKNREMSLRVSDVCKGKKA